MAKEEKGSKKQIQLYVNEYPKELNKAIGLGEIDWISPLADEKNKEYMLGKEARKKLAIPYLDVSSFWPSSGPHWDALGITKDKRDIILLEAKANVKEITSGCRSDNEDNRKKIVNSIEKTFGKMSGDNVSKNEDPLMKDYYQIANRYVFLDNINKYFAKTNDQRKCCLVFVYFTEDPYYTSTTEEDFNNSLKYSDIKIKAAEKKREGYVIKVFIKAKK
ncbi:MAG: hypothetical protein IJS65_00455 [Clostridia bacterium]|nr:hypothetical protein [Clostridia bacterium]